jgi:uncharacterized membrane protein YgdD (TMEM256/DUF423 family)
VKQTPWRIRGLLLFVFLGVMAIFECFGLLAGFQSIPVQAQKLGLSDTFETIRRVVLAICVLGVAVNAGATATMIGRRLPSWIRAYSRITAVWYGLYSLFLLISAFFITIGLQQRSTLVLGVMYALCAGVCLFAGTQTALELEEAQKPTTT